MLLDIEPHPEGLPQRVWNQHLDAFLTHGKLNPEVIPLLNDWQQKVINEVKKALKRLNKNARETTEDTE